MALYELHELVCFTLLAKLVMILRLGNALTLAMISHRYSSMKATVYFSHATIPLHNCRSYQSDGAGGEAEPQPSPAQVNSGKLPPWMLGSVNNNTWRLLIDALMSLQSLEISAATHHQGRQPPLCNPSPAIDTGVATNKIMLSLLSNLFTGWMKSLSFSAL